MEDRVPTYPGRVTLTPVEGAENTYDMVRADVPIQEGTPLNKATLLTDATAALLGLESDATVDDVLRILAQITPLARGGTGQATAPLGLFALIDGSDALASADIATGDCLAVVDVSAATGKKITLANLMSAINNRATAVNGSNTAYSTYMARGIAAGTSDLTAGSSSLTSGCIYLVYE